ncbi:MAG TPA: CAP domain-containing protein [Mycobacteriales bacterium]|nr:CAP domain-containing protein [Mycobacteriales bacterium]
MRTIALHTTAQRSSTAGRSVRIAVAAGIAAVGLALSASPAAADCDPAASLLGCKSDPTPPTTQPPTTPTTTPPATPPTTQAKPAVRDAQEQAPKMLVLMNAERTKHGLPLFSLRNDVTAVALDWSRTMAAKQTIWHNDGYFTAEMRARLNAKALAENVAMNDDVADAHRRLMASPGHRANLLNPSLTVVGLGITIDNRDMYYVTQNFLAPRAGAAPQPSAPKTTPRPRPTATAPRPAAAPPTRQRISAPKAPSSAAPAPAVLSATDFPTSHELSDHEGNVGLAMPTSMKLNPSPVANAVTGIHLALAGLAMAIFLGSLAPLVRLVRVRHTTRDNNR